MKPEVKEPAMRDETSGVQKVVVAAFLHDGDELLLARRAVGKAIAPGKYHLPGGHVEFGEHPAAALARELREELGIEAVVAESVWVFHYTSAGSHTVGIVYRVPLPVERSRLRWSLDDIAECIWVKAEDLSWYLSPDDHNLEAAAAGFELLRRTQPAS
jgi:8-oxo-dGTP diphosphatase